MSEQRSPYSLTWTMVKNTDAEVRYTADGAADGYEIVGTARKYGGGVRRVWKLYYNGTLLGSPARLAEAKRDADVHRGVSR
jgi:hypothetical protein